MNFDINKKIDSFHDGIGEVATLVPEKTKEFHRNFVSKAIPKDGKFGDVVKFTAGLVPGISEFNAIREGNWKEFAISAGIDIGSIGVGIVTAGTGFAAVKSGSVAAKAGVKAATKEIAEAGSKKLVKETAEAEIKKAVKETIGEETERVLKEGAETGGKKNVKEVTEESGKKASKEIANSKHIDDKDRVFREKDRLLPNKKYEINGYKYETDEKGRIISAEGKLRLNEDSGRNMERVKKYDGQEYREGDDEGHLIAHRFGGSDKLGNLVPMNGNLNKGDFKALENKLAAALEDNSDVRLKVEPIYEVGSNRPTEFKVSYSIEGDRTTTVFRNEGVM